MRGWIAVYLHWVGAALKTIWMLRQRITSLREEKKQNNRQIKRALCPFFIGFKWYLKQF